MAGMQFAKVQEHLEQALHFTTSWMSEGAE